MVTLPPSRSFLFGVWRQKMQLHLPLALSDLAEQALSEWWARWDLNPGPKDYE